MWSRESFQGEEAWAAQEGEGIWVRREGEAREEGAGCRQGWGGCPGLGTQDSHRQFTSHRSSLIEKKYYLKARHSVPNIQTGTDPGLFPETMLPEAGATLVQEVPMDVPPGWARRWVCMGPCALGKEMFSWEYCCPSRRGCGDRQRLLRDFCQDVCSFLVMDGRRSAG